MNIKLLLNLFLWSVDVFGAFLLLPHCTSGIAIATARVEGAGWLIKGEVGGDDMGSLEVSTAMMS